MKTLNIPLMATLLALSIIVCPILYFAVGPKLDESQLDVLKLLGIIAACSAAFCFVVGEITGNNSQMDKLWSLLPIAYTWVIAVKGGMNTRLVMMAVLATIWGIRLTINFARKGAYKLKFWEGVEDYRWAVVRSGPTFKKRWAWTLFDLGFISIYQNALVLMTTFPALVAMKSDAPFGWMDAVAAVLMLGFILWETVADEQQWRFQTRKWAMINEGKMLEELPEPYNKGFNTTGLWGHSRHPNYFAEQAIWICFYLFTIGAGMGIINWSIIGALLLIVLFQGSSSLAEEISSGKYPEYEKYCKSVPRFFPGKMKKLSFTILCIALIGCASPQQQEQNDSTMNKENNNELTAFDVQKEFQKNGFDWFTENLILCSGDRTESNAMTIGWGGIGNYLGHDRPAVTVYVAPGRYTWEFMEKYPRFTIMQFDNPEIWKYLGSHSGRDGDKAAALGLHVAYTEHGTPYYEEAHLVIECETMTAWHQTEQDFRNDTPKKWYDGFEAGIHTIYIGEVIGAWKR